VQLEKGVDPQSLPPEAREARVLITIGGNKTDAALIAAFPRLGMISCYGSGYEGVDLDAARARGIIVTHAGEANAAAVAEFTMGLVIATARNMVRGDRYMRRKAWRGDIVQRLSTTPGLAGRRLGIYGLGSIGKRIAKLATAFEMEIGYHNRKPNPDVAYAYHDSLVGLAEWSHVLVVSVRADASNTHSVNAEVMKALGPKGHLVNVSRGIAVDEDALCDALEAGTIAGAALDVYENEPSFPERLIPFDNVVLTPHIAAISGDGQRAQRDTMYANLEAFFAGKPVMTPVPDL
jgi:lactate dehydrogenase-like 2-hydroxyacid dehydrogenase